MKVTTETLEVFWEDDQPIGALLLNGSAQFYRLSKANKDFVREQLLKSATTSTAPVEESGTRIK